MQREARQGASSVDLCATAHATYTTEATSIAGVQQVDICLSCYLLGSRTEDRSANDGSVEDVQRKMDYHPNIIYNELYDIFWNCIYFAI